MHSPTISVIVPTHNRIHSLENCISSIKKQHADMEIIVIDDGSTDGTAEWLAKQDGVRTITHKKNQGVSTARNRGILCAKGQWIAFLDSDDEWHPRKLQTQIHAIAQEPSTKIIHTNERWIRHHTFVNPMNKHKKKGGYIFEDCLKICAISPSSVMIHKSLFNHVGLFDEHLPACEDYDLWIRITAHHHVTYIDEDLVTKYGGHEDQLSKKHWGMDRFRIYALCKLIKSGKLNNQQLKKARENLKERTAIMISGSKKRNNVNSVAYYTHIAKDCLG